MFLECHFYMCFELPTNLVGRKKKKRSKRKRNNNIIIFIYTSFVVWSTAKLNEILICVNIVGQKF